MLPSMLDKESNRRKPNEVRLVPRDSPVQRIQTMPVLAEWPNNPPKKQTLFVRRSTVDRQMYDVVIDMSYEKFVKCYASFCRGDHVQVAFPMLSADIREFILTGITPEQWARVFPPDKADIE